MERAWQRPQQASRHQNKRHCAPKKVPHQTIHCHLQALVGLFEADGTVHQAKVASSSRGTAAESQQHVCCLVCTAILEIAMMPGQGANEFRHATETRCGCQQGRLALKVCSA